MFRSLLLCLASLIPIFRLTAEEITGKIFHIDLETRSFELLKETEYDPKTDIGNSRIVVSWTDQTVVRRVEPKTSFAGIQGPIFAEFSGIDPVNAKALAQNKRFSARMAILKPDDASLAKLGIAENRVTARFTPDAGAEPRSGSIEIDGKRIPVSLRGNKAEILLHQKISPDELAKGFWMAKLVGTRSDGKFVASRMEVTSLPDPRVTDDPKLPRVLVIGDSISMNYHDAAKSALSGIANYHRNEGNAASSTQGVLNMELWLGNYQEKGFHWDVIQFNHGLHDLKQPYDAATGKWGEYFIPIETYKANLEKEIGILRKTGARLIWCSTTPVPNDNKGTFARRKDASKDFNAAALEVIRRHPDILITDLHLVIEESPVFDNWRKGNDVHFYKPEEQKLLGEAVASTVRKALEKPAKNLPLPGETFLVEGHVAFLILPENRDASKLTPWVWYAPTLPKLPGPEEKWMFEALLAQGVAIAGIDVGESMGNPEGRALFTAFHKEMVGKRGMSAKPCLLARSRGGLMHYNWAAENPNSLAAIAGIYPVGNLASWPGLGRAKAAYGMDEAGITAALTSHNPIDRLEPLAKAGVPLLHIHGDNDSVVPLDKNSGLIKERYDQLGGKMILEVIPGGGHDMKPDWFRNQKLVDFMVDQAKNGVR